MITKGTELAGYRIDDVIGQGGMGVVYKATQLSLERTVALKILAESLSQDPTFRERFRREGRVQAAMEHPHIVSVYEAGESEYGLWLAMRLVLGPNLKDLIAARRIDPKLTCRLLSQVADALETAHEAGLVHRDLKPQNILVGARSHAYLADFGLTKALGEAGLTRTGQFVGTLDYISPEQIRGEPPTIKSDLYALGAVLFECLSGVVPYPKESDAAVLFAHISEPPPSLRDHRPDLPTGLDEVIRRAMAKNPDERHESATAMLEDAEEALRSADSALLAPPAPIESPEEVGIRESATPPNFDALRQGIGPKPRPAATRARAEAPATAPPQEVPAEAQTPTAAPASTRVPPPAQTSAPSGAPVPAPETAENAGAVEETASPESPDPGFESGPRVTAGGDLAAPEAGGSDPALEATPETLSALEEQPSGETVTRDGGELPAEAPPSEETRDPEPEPRITAGETRGRFAPTRAPSDHSSEEMPSNGARSARPVVSPPIEQQVAEAPAATPGDAAGRRDRRSVPRVGVALAGVAALFAVAGFLLAPGSDSPTSPQGSTRPTTLTAGSLSLTAASGWRASDDAEIPGLTLENTAAIQMDGTRLVAGRSNGSGPMLLPKSFLQRVEGKPVTEPVRLGALEAYRHAGVAAPGVDGELTLYTVPTSAGVATIGCLAEDESGLAACESAATTLEIEGRSYPVGPDQAYASDLNGALRKLNAKRAQARRQLQKASSAGAQARAAQDASSAYSAAASTLGRLRLSPETRPANEAVVAALTASRKAYDRLADAARDKSESKYSSARTAVVRADAALQSALRGLKDLGYEVD